MDVFRALLRWFPVLALLMISCVPGPGIKTTPATVKDYEPSDMCKGCHTAIYEQYRDSMHSKAFSNPVFQAQFFEEIIPLMTETAEHRREAEECIACHDPIAFLRSEEQGLPRQPTGGGMDDVSCDFCHTLTGYHGEVPGDGRYISTPGILKQGPFRTATNWHRQYSEFHRKSEFCGVCHNDTNHNGLVVKSTFAEWRNSRYAAKGIQCQDCHMNVRGFLEGRKPVFEGGEAAAMTVGRAPERKRLYTHRFPGAHSQSQIEGALALRIETRKRSVMPGDEIDIRILVNNSRTGHKMPSGSADLRLMWLDVKAVVDGERVVGIPAQKGTPGEVDFDVAGGGTFDRTILDENVPDGCRVYRAIFVDDTGRQTLASHDAVAVAFDNRLEAAEIRKELYRFTIPAEATGAVRITANLNYLPYPRAFAERLKLRRADVVTVAEAERELTVR